MDESTKEIMQWATEITRTFQRWIREDATQEAVMAGLEGRLAGLRGDKLRAYMVSAACNLRYSLARPVNRVDIELARRKQHAPPDVERPHLSALERRYVAAVEAGYAQKGRRPGRKALAKALNVSVGWVRRVERRLREKFGEEG